MKHLTWAAVVVFVALLATLATIFGLDTDPAVRQQVLGWFEGLVPFVLGVGAGGAAGGAAGYAAGFMRGHRGAVGEIQKLVEAQRPAEAASPAPEPSALRRAAEVVRVAAEESHQAADEARAAAMALRVATEEGRAVAELQRSLLAETRRSLGAASDGSPQPSWPPPRAAQPGAQRTSA